MRHLYPYPQEDSLRRGEARVSFVNVPCLALCLHFGPLHSLEMCAKQRVWIEDCG